jgi:hypothetical protein
VLVEGKKESKMMNGEVWDEMRLIWGFVICLEQEITNRSNRHGLLGNLLAQGKLRQTGASSDYCLQR